MDEQTWGRKKVAVWVLTPGGRALAETVGRHWPHWDLFLSASLTPHDPAMRTFTSLKTAVQEHFSTYAGHLFIMASGIVVRLIAGLLRGKTKDPAAVVMDEAGQFAIPLVSGHLGGANLLAETVARFLGATAVITTATEVRGVLAVDRLATTRGWVVENPEAIKSVNMAQLIGRPVALFDPLGLLADQAPAAGLHPVAAIAELPCGGPGICIDYRLVPLPAGTLVLRPPVLVAGIGCRRGTSAAHLRKLLEATLHSAALSPASLGFLASVQLKSGEAGLLDLATQLNTSLLFFAPEILNGVSGISRPSPQAQHHIGVKSVCEAAAILAAGPGRLIVPKQTSSRATVAIAAGVCSSSASGPAHPTI